MELSLVRSCCADHSRQSMPGQQLISAWSTNSQPWSTDSQHLVSLVTPWSTDITPWQNQSRFWGQHASSHAAQVSRHYGLARAPKLVEIIAAGGAMRLTTNWGDRGAAGGATRGAAGYWVARVAFCRLHVTVLLCLAPGGRKPAPPTTGTLLRKCGSWGQAGDYPLRGYPPVVLAQYIVRHIVNPNATQPFQPRPINPCSARGAQGRAAAPAARQAGEDGQRHRRGGGHVQAAQVPPHRNHG